MKYYVLGSKGFIGSNISKVLKESNYDLVELDREKFDITNENDYKKYDFSNSIIIDCIVSVDSTSEQIELVNIDSFKRFLLYLKCSCKNFCYIYISTASTQFMKKEEFNKYIESKYLAEIFLREMNCDYKIVRLSFPFGIYENENRFLKRTIKKMINNESILINNIFLQLTPIEYLNSKVLSIIKEKDYKEINFTYYERYFSIIELFKYIQNRTNYKNISFSDNEIISSNLKISTIEHIKIYIEPYIKYYFSGGKYE